jgi:eukaryotic-like serine/threonine-protein kinase
MPAVTGASGTPVSIVHGYEILQTLTEGGMGKIYLARQHALNRLVCVKVLSIPAGEDADLCRSRFCREAELLASVSHPHILSIFDFGATADLGLPFLVTEYIEAGDLRRLMNGGQALPIAQVRSIVSQVGEALTHLHEKGILHRDLKPENILMPTDRLAKVGDFGIAVMQGKAGRLTQTVCGMGTVGYVSPEQQYGLNVDERTDVYSLAAVSYELLTARRPLGSFPPPSQLNTKLSRQLDAVILQGLAEEPKDRYRSVREFVTAFDRALPRPPEKATVRTRVLTAVLTLLLMLLGVQWTGRFASKPGAAATPRLGQIELPPKAPDATENTGDAIKSAPDAKVIDRLPELRRLVELRAYVIWHQSGRPTGDAGEAVKDKNWLLAEGQVLEEVKARAFKIWEEQGRPGGSTGEAVRDENMRAAACQVLKETEAEMRRHPID